CWLFFGPLDLFECLERLLKNLLSLFPYSFQVLFLQAIRLHYHFFLFLIKGFPVFYLIKHDLVFLLRLYALALFKGYYCIDSLFWFNFHKAPFGLILILVFRNCG